MQVHQWLIKPPTSAYCFFFLVTQLQRELGSARSDLIIAGKELDNRTAQIDKLAAEQTKWMARKAQLKTENMLLEDRCVEGKSSSICFFHLHFYILPLA